MKRFDMITEAEARVLAPGSTIELAPGGHITPLAQDTLRELRITVVRGGGVDEASARELAPVADIRSVIVGSDHTGVALRQAIVAHLRGQGLAVQEVGPEKSSTPADYPEIAGAVGVAVARKDVDAGIVIDGAGLGSAMAANKIAGIRAAMCTTPTLARYAREHNGANVLSLGATLLTTDAALAIVDVWRTTPMSAEPRYLNRLANIKRLEERSR